MGRDAYRSYLEEEFNRVHADEKEAIIFLASIIPKKDRERIRQEIESDSKFMAKEHFFLGMKTRNVLRMAGFFYDPHVMDHIWFSWLKKAVCLPEEEVTLTDSLKERIQKYGANLKKYKEQELSREKKAPVNSLDPIQTFLGSYSYAISFAAAGFILILQAILQTHAFETSIVGVLFALFGASWAAWKYMQQKKRRGAILEN